MSRYGTKMGMDVLHFKKYRRIINSYLFYEFYKNEIYLRIEAEAL